MTIALELSGITYKYPGSSEPVLQDLNISFRKGGFHVICGPRGSGKSTLLRLARGFWSEYGGELTGDITLFGRSILKRSVSELGSEVAIVFQNPAHQMHQLRVIDELMSPPSYQGLDWHECENRALSMARKSRIVELLSRNPSRISSGEQQRVAIAAALTMDAKLLLIDEPISFLDPRAGSEILNLIKAFHENGKTVVLATHDVQRVAKIANSVALLSEGHMVARGSPRKILYSKKARDLVGTPLLVETASRMLEARILSNPVMDWSEVARLMPDNPNVVNRKGPHPQRGTGRRMRTPAVVVQNLSFSYEPGDRVLDNISLAINDGEIFGLVGFSGSGKTTFSKILIGLLRPEAGKVFLLGREISGISTSDLARSIGYVFQNPTEMLLTQSVEDECRLGRRALRLPDSEKHVQDLLTRFGLKGLGRRNPYSLSGGQQRLLTIAAVVSTSPRIIILDEPDFGLDMKSWGSVKRIIKNLATRGHTIILITHNLEETLFLCDRIAVIAKGQVFATAHPYWVLRDRQLLEAAGLGQVPISSVVSRITVLRDSFSRKAGFRKALAVAIRRTYA